MSEKTVPSEAEMAQALGFDSIKEMVTMIASVPLSKPGAMRVFLKWKDEDGTKAGLEKILKELR